MANTIHLLVTEGPENGREIHVPPAGIRIGRSSRNDISIEDGTLSRFQCRFFMKPGGELWVSDLGSVNGTTVNGLPVQEQRLQLQDEILLGMTRLKVVHAGEETATPMAIPAAAPGGETTLDLGLSRAGRATGHDQGGVLRRKLVFVAGMMALVVALAWMPWGKLGALITGSDKALPPVPVEVVPDLELTFEHVEGGVSNIFRYQLDLRKGSLAVQVDDLQSDRHVRREKKVDSGLIADLARSLQATRIFDLREDYSGLAPGIYEASDLSVTIGLNTRRIKVVNHVEPDEFAAARGMIEEFGKNELGLAALAIDPATLIEVARTSLLQAKKLREEREVREDNLFNAIRAFKECELYLETIEPKPVFYGEALNGRSDCERDLQRRYDDLRFVAERAVKLRDWAEADRQLKIICEMIPDRSDERNKTAGKTLVDVQRHLTTDK
jgi:hypothetical protein